MDAYPDHELRCVAVEPLPGSRRLQLTSDGWPMTPTGEGEPTPAEGLQRGDGSPRWEAALEAGTATVGDAHAAGMADAGRASPGDAAETSAWEAPGPVAGALLSGLRRPRDEAQLTRTIAEVARADPGFASAFVELVLEVAARGRCSERVRALLDRGIPPSLSCRAEAQLGDSSDAGLGRVDLRFDGDEDLTLFIENKLDSGYGDDQLERYLAALERLPAGRRAGLVAITRNVPTTGEEDLDERPGWLGSVRWAHLRAADQLRDLPVADELLRRQWKIFVELLDRQGDLGMTRADTDLIRAWARYTEGREHLADILDQAQQPALEIVEREVRKRYSRRAEGEPLVAPFTRGQRRQTVHRDQVSVYLGFRIPARVRDSALRIQFSGHYGVPHFTVQVEPWEAQYRLEDDEAFSRSARALGTQGFQSNGRYWARVHEPSEYLDAGDLPAALVELIEQDVRPLIDSGILDHDVDSVVTGSWKAPPRYRKDARPE